MAYLLKRTDGKYVAKQGAKHSYTGFVSARRFATREEAEGNRCVENEYIVDEHDVTRERR